MSAFPESRIYSRIDDGGSFITIHPPVEANVLAEIQNELGETGQWGESWKVTEVGEDEDSASPTLGTPHTHVQIYEGDAGYHQVSDTIRAASSIGHALAQRMYGVHISNYTGV
jgi:hypothetical protein